MTEVFIDTSYWLAMLNLQDAYHQWAMEVSRPPRMVTTRAVQIEVMDALSAPRVRALAVQFWQATNNDANLLVVFLDAPLLHRAAVLFSSRNDKAWSMTDCISFAAMEDRHITAALTSDHHFEQAGFQALLKSS